MNDQDIFPSMNSNKQQFIQNYIQSTDAQERIQKKMQEIRLKATVSISRASALTGFSEQQLRAWEAKGLLKAERPSPFSKQKDKDATGHRQYALSELDKLVLIKELLDEDILSTGDIPTFAEDIWHSFYSLSEKQSQTETQGKSLDYAKNKYYNAPIDERIKEAREKLFWRYFVSRALRLSLALISEDIPGKAIGLVLPLQGHIETASIKQVEDLANLGELLVGWLSQSFSSHTLLTSLPLFQYSTDFRVQQLWAMKAAPMEEMPQDNTLVIVQREAKALSLSYEAVETIRILLRPLYEDAEISRSCFGLDMNDVVDPSPNIANSMIYPDIILNGLADMAVRLSCQDDESHRAFCCILLPEELESGLQKASLVVQAQSKYSPHQIGMSRVTPVRDFDKSPSLRAFYSGNVIYRSVYTTKEPSIAFHEIENFVNSAIAIPVGGEGGEPIAVLYLATSKQNAFLERDRSILRMIGRMIGELLETYNIRRKEAAKLGNLILYPDVVDELLGVFPSENHFTRDVEALLNDFKVLLGSRREASLFPSAIMIREDQGLEDSISFIAVDVDNQRDFTSKFGSQIGRNLSLEIGLRIQGELDSTFKKYKGCQCYHIFADRFYVLLKGVPFDQVIAKAKLFKKSLDGQYRVSILPHTSEGSLPRSTLQEVPITVRLAVSSYTRELLEELLQLQSVQDTIMMIDRALSTQLKKGMEEKGDQIRYWDPRVRRYERLSLED